MNLQLEKIKAIAIDFDWTLVSFNIDGAFKRTQQYLKIKYPEASGYLENRFRFKKNMVYFHLHRDNIWKSLINNNEIEKHYIGELHTIYWRELQSSTNEIVGARDFLKLMKSLKMKTAIVTNSDGLPGLKITRVRDTGLDKYVDVVFIAGDDCIEKKPNYKVFIKAAERTKVPKENFLMIGDKISEDIIPATIAGMQTVLFKSKYGGDWNPSVKSYEELIRFFKDYSK